MSATKFKLKTIIVCDDNSDILEFVCTLLSHEGYNVVAVRGHGEIETVLKSVKPDLLILDIQMPVHSGIWIAEELQARGMQVPIIFMTAFDDPIYRMNALVTGAIEYLIKPFDAEVLIEKVANSIGVKATQSNWDLRATKSSDSSTAFPAIPPPATPTPPQPIGSEYIGLA